QRGGNRNDRLFHLHFAICDLHIVTKKRPRRRTGSDGAVIVIDAARTGAHEQFRAFEPAHRASEMSTINGEGNEAILADSTQPDSALRAHTSPWERRRISHSHGYCFTDLKIIGLA